MTYVGTKMVTYRALLSLSPLPFLLCYKPRKETVFASSQHLSFMFSVYFPKEPIGFEWYRKRSPPLFDEGTPKKGQSQAICKIFLATPQKLNKQPLVANLGYI